MNYYQDITLLPDAEVSLGFLWQKIFQQVHIALVDNKVGENKSAVALSIVHYGNKDFPLGHIVRLFSDRKDVLEKLNVKQWLTRLSDYCHVSSIKAVPDTITQYACFTRKPVKSIYKKAQRRAEHLDKPYEEVLAYLVEENKSKECKLPFIHVESQKTKKCMIEKGEQGQYKFRLFIERALAKCPVEGVFDCYGLSKTATVPWF